MNEIAEMCLRFEPVGSRITCNPPPTDTDEDFLLLVDASRSDDLLVLLSTLGWKLGGSRITNEREVAPVELRFQSYTYGDKNLIITQSEEFFKRFMAATHVCKRLNLLNKEDRIALSQAVLYANCY